MKTRCGTPGFSRKKKFCFLIDFFRYMAPEIFSSKGYNEKVDIFSVGILLYTLYSLSFYID